MVALSGVSAWTLARLSGKSPAGVETADRKCVLARSNPWVFRVVERFFKALPNGAEEPGGDFTQGLVTHHWRNDAMATKMQLGATMLVLLLPVGCGNDADFG